MSNTSDPNTFTAPVETDNDLQSAAREAGWALMELVDSIDWQKRGHVSEIITNLGLALSADTPSPSDHVEPPAGWFNPPNDLHGYQQVAKEFEGQAGTVPLYLHPPVNQTAGITIDAAEAKALLYGQPKHECLVALSRLANWLADQDDTPPNNAQTAGGDE